jgi:hypothetical protein
VSTDSKQVEHATVRLLSSLSVLILVIWLGHCGGLTDIRREACVYKTGNPQCHPQQQPEKPTP